MLKDQDQLEHVSKPQRIDELKNQKTASTVERTLNIF